MSRNLSSSSPSPMITTQSFDSQRAKLVPHAAPMGIAHPSAHTPPLDGHLQGPVIQPPSILQQSSHPTALVFHLLFRGAAILYYMLEWTLSINFILSFVVLLLLLACDFWTVKNVTGRLLVGLRWWNEIREDGSNVWIFESRPNRQVNPVDARVFWLALHATWIVWTLFALLCVLKFSFTWLLVTFVALSLNGANLVGYWRCEKDAKQKMSDFSGNSVVQGAIGNFIASRFTTMFSGSSHTSAPRPEMHV
ncbi:hypothetical protein SeLEV6574_g07327 [Synchytrium endobioticum]|uniref:Golgi apparatus membrane protein TVP23 n=1 Tax=Synchytrium endobioticum TaxID=286115 RepID=A0A507CIN7_9FUNG|nr:hypothetical protein SeLEV6574_g07327 [Synchytrium endobioticum]